MPTATAAQASEYVTREEIAAILRVHPNTISKWLADGWFPKAVRLGAKGRWLRWRRSIIERFISELEEGKHATAKR